MEHQSRSDEQRRAIGDSPWFWLLLFCGVALVGLQVLDFKYRHRQAQIEKQHQGRQYALWQASEPDRAEPPPIEFSSPERTVIGLGPLRLVIFALAVVAAVALARERRQPREPT